MSEPKTPPRELDPQTQKHIDRFLQGKEAWNEWANDMLARKAKLEAAGNWQVRHRLDDQGRWRLMSDDTSIAEIQAWLDEAYVDFSSLIFQTEPSSDLQEGGEESHEEKSAIVKSISVTGDFVDFSGFIFPSEADFKEAEFQGAANFWQAEFQGAANFWEAKFQGVAYFGAAKFQGAVYFAAVKFQGAARFWQAEFQGVADFWEAKFQGVADFWEAKFQEVAEFHLVDFEKYATFANAKFHGPADFEAILVKRAFNLVDAEFTASIPNFTQANFSESPRLDDIVVMPTPKINGPFSWQRYFWQEKFIHFLLRLTYRLSVEYPKHLWNKFTNIRRNPDEEAHYRALKRLAIQAHDHENEMKFFTGEIRARRHITDFMWPWKKGFASSARYWAGVAYELFSDFGRSFIRPTLWWFTCLWLFANLTLSGVGLLDTTKCHNSQLTPKEAATTIGLKNSLLILGLTKTNIVKQAELCLYGKNKNGAAESNPKPYDPKIKRSYQTKSTKVESTKTDIPFKAAVQGIAHSLLSLLFIFLLLLAIRNQFKIK